MNPTIPEQALASYHSFIDEQFDGAELAGLAEFLGVDLTDEDRDQAIDAVVVAMVSPGFFEELMRSFDNDAMDAFLGLLDLGDLLPTRYLAPRSEEEHETTSRAFALLKKTGLVILSTRPESVVVIHPLARVLLAETLEKYRHARFATLKLEPTAPCPLRSMAALTLNFVRTDGMRITNKGDFYQRLHEKATKLFGTVNERWGAPLFDFLILSFLSAGATSVNEDGFVVIQTERARDLLNSPLREFAVEILFRDDSTSSLAISLLELLIQWREELPDGWTSTRHIVTRGSLFDFHYHADDDDRLLETAMTLHILGLVDVATMDGQRWFRPNAAGEALLSLLESGDIDQASSQPDETCAKEAIVQPSLEILVPLDATANTHWRVGAFGKLKSVDTHCTYEIDKAHCQAVFSRERLDFDEWIVGLSEVARHGVPDNIERTLRAWLGQQAVVELSRGTVMRVRGREDGDATLSDAVRNNLSEAARKLKAKRVAPDVYVIPEGTRNHQIAAALNQNNLLSEDLAVQKSRRWFAKPIEAEPQDMLRTLSKELDEIRHHQRTHLDAINFFHLASPFMAFDGGASPGSVERDSWAIEDPQASPDRAPAADDRAFDPRPEEVSELLHAAVRHGKAVEILLDDIYHNASRVIVPESILRRGSQNYLTGLCLETKEHRAFNLEYVRRARFVERDEPSAS